MTFKKKQTEAPKTLTPHGAHDDLIERPDVGFTRPAEAPEVRVARERLERFGSEQRMNALLEALALVQQARDLEVSRGRTAALPEGCFTLQRLLIAVLEVMTPEQRAEVRRRLG
jgi:hypothetical protein